MRSVATWLDRIHDKDKIEQCVYDLCFSPDGSRLIVAAGNRVLVYDTNDGTLIRPLKGHKETVHCVCYSHDGKRFASGGADKSVIIWTAQLDGILKYSHNDSIQALAYNPVSHQLLSCAVSDFGLWSSEQKNVTKYKSSSRICCCAWTSDGQYMAIGLGNGVVSIKNKNGEEKVKIERPDGACVFAIAFNPAREENYDVLCVADWNQTLSFYFITGKMAGRERSLGFDPCFLRFFNKGEYLMVGGSNKEALLYTKEGVRLGVIGEQQSWVWCCAAKPDSNYVALGCHDGTVAYYQLIFATVHGLYKERYAFRENMTDVIIQHLITDQKVRIKCRDLVKKIAIYKRRLAVQLPERVIIYELYSQEATDMHYRVREKINKKLDCNLLVVCTANIVLCQEKRLQSLDFAGRKEREWLMDSLIRYIKVVGGPSCKEGLLLGLKNGQVLKIFLDNPFPVLLLKIPSAIRCLDLNPSRKKLAVVDEHNTLLVYKVDKNELIYEEQNANSVAWNTYFEDMLCFSGNNSLNIKASNFPVHSQKLQGFVVGFSGSKIFCLHIYNMSTIEVPQSTTMYQYLDKKLFDEAYLVACMGVTEADFENLAYAALKEKSYDVALKAFMKIKNVEYASLILSIDEKKDRGTFNDDVFMAYILAYQGKFSEAAKLFKKSGNSQHALEMYSDLRMFDLAQEFIDSEDTGYKKDLIKKKAEWARDINEPRAAAQMYLSAGETLKAVEIMGENGWVEMIIDVARKLDKSKYDELLACADHLKNLKAYNFAMETYKKIGNNEAIATILVASKDWQEAFIWAEKYPEFKEMVYLPYAISLAEQDKFLQAQKAFHDAGKPEEAFRVLEKLTENAVNENRFDDAGYYFWMLSMQALQLAGDKNADDSKSEMLKRFEDFQRKASMYYVYHTIQRYMDEPFTSYMPEALFNIARFLMHELMSIQPNGISKFSTFYTLAKQAKNVEAFKLSRYALDKIQQLRIPSRFQEDVDMASLKIRAKPYQNSEDQQPLCYRCSTSSPLVNNSGNRCSNCCHPFVYSFISFEILPLVEFVLEDGISDDEAYRLIISTNSSKSGIKSRSFGDHGPNSLEQTDQLILDDDKNSQQADQLVLDDDYSGKYTNYAGSDPFAANFMNYYTGADEYTPIVLNRAALANLEPHEVIINHWQKPLKNRYYKNLMPDVPITSCKFCNKMFHIDDFVLQVLQKGHCPFCRSTDDTFDIKNEDDNAQSI